MPASGQFFREHKKMQFWARARRAPLVALFAAALISASWLGPQPAAAQPAASKASPAARKPATPNATSKAPAAKPAAPATPAPAAPPRSGKGWQVGAIPAWVAAPPAPDANAPKAPAVGARREQLVDLQTNHTTPKPQVFVRIRSVALDAGALGSVSQWQIGFNPAFQTVVIHHASVLREGQRSERLAEARIEPMRREQRLEQQVLDGGETLLVVLSDVRVGDAVELAYTVEGENPIFEGRISGGMRLGYDTPVDLLHHRWVLPANKTVFTKPLAGKDEAEKFSEGTGDKQVQVLRAVRHQVAAIAQEQGTPPWFKIYPAIDISEYASWSEVDAWAQRLFALPSPTPPTVAAKAEALKASGLKDEALISEALRFVQDEVRYLSVSLGESSHRPKPPQQTLAELLGDCKDKTVLLNALLRELGFDAKAALVSVQRNRGVRDYLPSHELFDHVITRVEHQGRVWFLDATVNGQGLQMDTRAQFPYGAALVVGAGSELQTVPEPPAAVNRLQFEQRWDLREPGRPAQLAFTMRAIGLPAERWRAGQAQAGVQALSQALGGSFARLLPGLKTVGEPEVVDDRQANRWQFTQRFEVAELGQYNRGAIEAEFGAMELLDVLTGPSETQRRTPFLVDQPRLVESRIEIQVPVALNSNVPAPLEIVERQFRFSARMEVQGRTAGFVRRYERRDDQVLPTELSTWREKILQARQGSFGRLRLPLLEDKAIVPELEKVERRVRNARGARNDALQGLILRNEFGRTIDGQVLQKAPAGSPLAQRVLVSRAISHNLLGDHAQALADADAVLALRPDDAEALDARGVALAGAGKAEEALASFARINPAARPASAASWMGSLQFMRGRPAEAETLLREAVANGTGEGREFALLWLYLATEAQGGRGAAAVDEHVEATDAQKLPGALLRFLLGRIDRAALLKQASASPEMERLNLAEAHFFIGQKLLLQGQREEAMRAFQRCLDTGATPYRELSFARMAMQGAAR
jgi:lipoprotein NlpI